MGRLLATLLLSTLFQALPANGNDPASAGQPQVALNTTHGTIVMALYPDKAPATVEHFLETVDRYFYDGLIFHRVVKGFMIQTGGHGYDLQLKESGEAVTNESQNGLNNTRGTVAMARLADPDSARTQFFINVVDNPHLDADDDKPGYTVFGKVIDGMEVVDAISEMPVTRKGTFTHLPVDTVQILSARVVPQP